jgi:hypothetical protein
VQFHNHCSQVLEARQIAHFTLVGRGDDAHQSPAPGAHQLLVATFAPRPQLNALSYIIDLGPVNFVPWPSKNPRPVILSHLDECTRTGADSKNP